MLAWVQELALLARDKQLLAEKNAALEKALAEERAKNQRLEEQPSVLEKALADEKAKSQKLKEQLAAAKGEFPSPKSLDPGSL